MKTLSLTLMRKSPLVSPWTNNNNLSPFVLQMSCGGSWGHTGP